MLPHLSRQHRILCPHKDGSYGRTYDTHLLRVLAWYRWVHDVVDGHRYSFGKRGFHTPLFQPYPSLQYHTQSLHTIVDFYYKRCLHDGEADTSELSKTPGDRPIHGELGMVGQRVHRTVFLGYPEMKERRGNT